MAAIALVLALALVELVLPAFNALLGTRPRVRLFRSDPGARAARRRRRSSPDCSPAAIRRSISPRSSPARCSRATSRAAAARRPVRKALVVLQFAISIALLIATAVVYQQMRVRAQHRPRLRQGQIAS